MCDDIVLLYNDAHSNPHSEPLTFFTVAVGIMRAGFAVFPISPRNSPAAVAHLLRKTSPAHLLVGPEPSLKELVAASYKIFKEDGAEPPRFSEMPFFDAIYEKGLAPFEPLPPVKRGLDDIVLIMHSSGEPASCVKCPVLTDFPRIYCLP